MCMHTIPPKCALHNNRLIQIIIVVVVMMMQYFWNNLSSPHLIMPICLIMQQDWV